MMRKHARGCTDIHDSRVRLVSMIPLPRGVTGLYGADPIRTDGPYPGSAYPTRGNPQTSALGAGATVSTPPSRRGLPTRSRLQGRACGRLRGRLLLARLPRTLCPAAQPCPFLAREAANERRAGHSPDPRTRGARLAGLPCVGARGLREPGGDGGSCRGGGELPGMAAEAFVANGAGRLSGRSRRSGATSCSRTQGPRWSPDIGPEEIDEKMEEYECLEMKRCFGFGESGMREAQS